MQNGDRLFLRAAHSFYRSSNASSFLLPISVPILSSFPISTLLDCGASDNFIDTSIAPLHLVYTLPEPISLFLFDGSPTPSGVITHAINLTITVPGFAPKEVVFYLTKLHQLAKLVLGLSWLRLENPLVDWVALTVSLRSPQFPTGCSWPETFSTIPELHLQDLIQVVPTHTPPAVPSHPAMATLSSVNLKPHDFDSTIAVLRFASPYPSSGTTTWYPTLTTLSKDPMEDDPSMVSDEDTEDSTPNPDPDALPKPPEVRIIGAATFSTLMKQGCFWGLIAVSDLLHADAQATLRTATPKPPLATVVPMSPKERAEFERTVHKQYHDYADVFSETAAASLPPHRLYDYTIDLEEGATPPYGPIYSMSETELKALREHLDDALGKGFIRPSNSPAGAPILFVK